MLGVVMKLSEMSEQSGSLYIKPILTQKLKIIPNDTFPLKIGHLSELAKISDDIMLTGCECIWQNDNFTNTLTVA